MIKAERRLVYRLFAGLVLLTSSLCVTPASAYDQLVQKQEFEIERFRTQSGAVIKNVKVGWEAYGALSPQKDNVILITHFFSGTSHAAGRYTENDTFPGYWDAIIGAGKAIDTDKYYVISVDSLVNLNANDPNV
ncbi:MAG: E22 family MetX-like putative esterase, partial [Hyphococcus sp.]